MAALLAALALGAGRSAAPPPVQWTLANSSNVYGGSYHDAHVHQAEGAMATELACRSACEAAAACKSYTWTPGPSSPRKDCRYTHQCWWRDDSVWDLRNTNKCDGRN